MTVADREKEREGSVFLIDGIPYQALEEPDLTWLRRYGTVFQVMDRQFFGNLCFGVTGPYGRLFIKYAGAKTVNFRGKPANAVYALHSAMPLYDREHPALTKLMACGPAGDGYAAIFAWRDAVPLRLALDRVRELPLEKSLRMLDMVFDLHAAMALDGIVASDFQDGSVLIDFDREEAIVCDIDLYRRKPAFNDKGRLRGSSLFMAPEEYELNAALDETTTEYNMAALAFAFFGGYEDRGRRAWKAPECLWEVAHRAVSESKADRYPSMRAFLDAWREAVGQCGLTKEGIL
jgi:serine/threonine-protein kinase